MKRFVRAAVVSLIGTLICLVVYAFLIGKLEYYPTAGAADLAKIPVEEQAAWREANIRTVKGREYAVFLVRDPGARGIVLSAVGFLFLFGTVCAYVGSRLEPPGRVGA